VFLQRVSRGADPAPSARSRRSGDPHRAEPGQHYRAPGSASRRL